MSAVMAVARRTARASYPSEGALLGTRSVLVGDVVEAEGCEATSVVVDEVAEFGAGGEDEPEGGGRDSVELGSANAGALSSSAAASKRTTYCPVSVKSSLANPAKFLQTCERSARVPRGG